MTSDVEDADSPELSSVLSAIPRWAKGGGVAIAAIGALSFLLWAGQVTFDRSVPAMYRLEPASIRAAFAPTNGALAAIYVNSGDVVKTGAPLAEIDGPTGLQPVRAPSDGVVARAPSGPIGRIIGPGEAIASVAPQDGAAMAILLIAPRDAGRAPGAAVSFASAPDLRARVVVVDPAPVDTARGPALRVVARLSPPLAYAGAGTAEIQTGRESLFALVFGSAGSN